MSRARHFWDLSSQLTPKCFDDFFFAASGATGAGAAAEELDLPHLP